MNHRPYPAVDRALHQLERGRVPDPPRCPICDHPVNRHALEEGQRVCTRGPGRISCRDCAELWARMPAVAALANFGMMLRHGSGRQVLVEHPRKAGKSAIVAAITEQAVKAGDHVHVASRDGVRRLPAASNATVFSQSVARAGVAAESARARALAAGLRDDALVTPQVLRTAPIVLARVIRTCTAVPSQWDAWTVDGQYLYLRYRSGIGTVDAYDSPESDEWPQPPDGRIAIFDTGETYGGDMTLVDFCERTGLQLADDAEVIGE